MSYTETAPEAGALDPKTADYALAAARAFGVPGLRPPTSPDAGKLAFRSAVVDPRSTTSPSAAPEFGTERALDPKTADYALAAARAFGVPGLGAGPVTRATPLPSLAIGPAQASKAREIDAIELARRSAIVAKYGLATVEARALVNAKIASGEQP
jgi:hypothetical protein